MILKSTQIKGTRRGHEIGFPTINLVVPEDFELSQGIYAAWVGIDNTTYKGALHYGSIPTFNLTDKTLEVHLLDISDETVPQTENILIEIDVVEKLRDIRNFDTPLELAIQIERDVEKVRSILK